MSDVSLLGSYGGAGGSSLSFRNILINGEVSRVNQRGFDGNWSAKSVGEYGYDRWKKADASNISQVVEEGNFVPDAEYVLSGNGVTTEVLTAPSSGNWTITVPNTASYVQLERGSVPSPFEHRPIGMELSLCQRYYEEGSYAGVFVDYGAYACSAFLNFIVEKRIAPYMALSEVSAASQPVMTFGTTRSTLGKSAKGFAVYNNNTAGTVGYGAFTWTADAEL